LAAWTRILTAPVTVPALCGRWTVPGLQRPRAVDTSVPGKSVGQWRQGTMHPATASTADLLACNAEAATACRSSSRGLAAGCRAMFFRPAKVSIAHAGRYRQHGTGARSSRSSPPASQSACFSGWCQRRELINPSNPSSTHSSDVSTDEASSATQRAYVRIGGERATRKAARRNQCVAGLRDQGPDGCGDEYAPGAAPPPNSRAKSAFVYAYVISGSIDSQVNDPPFWPRCQR